MGNSAAPIWDAVVEWAKIGPHNPPPPAIAALPKDDQEVIRADLIELEKAIQQKLGRS